MKYFSLLVSIFFTFTLSSEGLAQQSPTHRLTLKDAFTRSLAANPGVEGARVGIGLADARKDAISSVRFPRLSLGGDYTLNDKEVSLGGEDDGTLILPKKDWSYRLTFRQPVFAGARDLYAYRQAKLGIEGAKEDLRQTTNLVLFQVGTQYLAVLQADAFIEIEERSVILSTKRLKQATDFYEVGEVTRVDVLRAKAAIMASERRLAEALQFRQSAAGRLRISLALEGSIEVEPFTGFLPSLPGQEVLMAEALSSTPALRQADLDLDIARLEIKKKRGAFLPTLWMDGGWIRQESSFPSDNYGFLALNLAVPLYQGGEARAKVREAREGERLAIFRREDVRRSVREDVQSALLEYETSKIVLDLARDELESAVQEYSEIRELYSAQETTSLDVEASEISLIRSEKTVATSEVAVAVAKLRVYYLVGTLAEAVIGNPEGEDTP